MPREIHHIIFTPEEVKTAVVAYRRTHPNFLPPGIVARFALGPGGLALTVEMQYGSNRHALDFTLDAALLVEPLIKFCAENNIACPRGDRHAVQITDRDVTLEVTVNAVAAAAASAVAPAGRVGALPLPIAARPAGPRAQDAVATAAIPARLGANAALWLLVPGAG